MTNSTVVGFETAMSNPNGFVSQKLF